MTDREKALEAALTAMVEEQCDYMRINHLGDPERQHNIKLARAALAMPATDRAGREADVAHAARVILTALHRAQIDMTILRKFLNGKPNAALTALANLTPPEDAP
jgi:hypothetical protein